MATGTLSPDPKQSIFDTNGNPLVNVPVFLSGAATANTTTDSSGLFSFVNLTAGANYNVQPKQVGYLFTEYNQDFVNLSGEQTVVFNGAASAFQISGQIVDGAGNGVSGVTVELGGASRTAYTNTLGYYRFEAVAAGETYVFSVKSKRYKFEVNSFVLFIGEDEGDV